ncbi:MAG: LysM peptidoglycan-binding domain-containing protein [Puniceicoccales bacterium]|jgi:tetratricopeptide (TPR) repeat protein|nr:LysM peptidoglycan-binding domain-containing protein [Puniceicoccales bacterium]
MAYLSLFALCGCGRLQSRGERWEKFFHRGQDYVREGKEDAALRCFLAAAQHNSKCSAEAHLECGELFLNRRKDPLSAIYHYREYLKKSPPANRQVALVRQRVATAEKAYLEQIPILRQLVRESHGDMLRTLKMMQDENGQLKRKVAVLHGKIDEMRTASSSAAKLAEVAGASMASGGGACSPRTYAVSGGDTLSSISLKVYGTAARWREIFEANRDQLKSPAQLRVGALLMVP